MTSSTKPEVRNISQIRNTVRGGPNHSQRQHAQKFGDGRVWKMKVKAAGLGSQFSNTTELGTGKKHLYICKLLANYLKI